jgi:DNA-directed RNA polymerase subunit RPC12/RpoP
MPEKPGSATEADTEEDDVYEIPATEAEIPAEWRSSAVYKLEAAVRCPYCREAIRTLKIVRLTRLQVAFTSTLPRGGRAIVCPQCERVLSAELSGLI